MCILGELAFCHSGQIDHGDRNLGPAEQLRGTHSAFASDQFAVWLHHDRVKQSKFFNVACEPFDIAEIAAMPLADLDVGDLLRFLLRAMRDSFGLPIRDVILSGAFTVAVAALDALPGSHALRALASCQRALFATVIPMRRGLNCVTIGPMPALIM